ncbi:uncharacterized protein [Haliotis asinina]|uniref:uncharacterized protein n=1 Tax=Haliotis asinina TaxID=109174 RepID=UPI0035318D78
MSLPMYLCLVYCASVLWIVPFEAAKTKKAECKYTISSDDQPISVNSTNLTRQGYDKCIYNISAPSQKYIRLNFTKISGRNGTNNMCVSLNETMDGKRSETINEVNETHHVFQSSSNSIRIIYVLNKCQPTSGFTVSFKFLPQKDVPNCAHRCDSSTCLSSANLCDGKTDCIDKSDESDRCPSPKSDSIPYILIFGLVILITLLGVVVCLMRHNNCRIMSRVRRHDTREGQLRPPSQNSDVLVSSPTQEHMEQQVSLLQDRYTQIKSMQRDSDLGYPPHVPRSKDGEEGYRESQKDILNHRQIAAANLECFRPPPNRTVHDTESPPPYSESPNRSFDSYTKTQPSVQDYNGCPVVIRCYSMSGSANGESHPDFYSNSHSRTYSSSSVGHGVRSVLSDRPPGYENFSSNSVPTAPSVMTSGHRHCNSAPVGEGQGSRSSSAQSSPPDYHNAFNVTSANMYRPSTDKANV